MSINNMFKLPENDKRFGVTYLFDDDGWVVRTIHMHDGRRVHVAALEKHHARMAHDGLRRQYPDFVLSGEYDVDFAINMVAGSRPDWDPIGR